MDALAISQHHTINALLHSVEHLHELLDQAATITHIAAKSPSKTDINENCVFSNLQKLIDDAQTHSKNIELTLLEEINHEVLT